MLLFSSVCYQNNQAPFGLWVDILVLNLTEFQPTLVSTPPPLQHSDSEDI